MGEDNEMNNDIVRASADSISQVKPVDDVDVELPPVPFEVTGELVYADDALSAIAQHAIDMTDGIGVLAKQPTGILSRFSRHKVATPQLRMKSKTDTCITFDVDVWVSYGMSITRVCDQLQKTVSNELKRITGKTGVVNIHVRGLV
jgi:uncharacterized alkaline shock family protein YloU